MLLEMAAYLVKGTERNSSTVERKKLIFEMVITANDPKDLICALLGDNSNTPIHPNLVAMLRTSTTFFNLLWALKTLLEQTNNLPAEIFKTFRDNYSFKDGSFKESLHNPIEWKKLRDKELFDSGDKIKLLNQQFATLQFVAEKKIDNRYLLDAVKRCVKTLNEMAIQHPRQYEKLAAETYYGDILITVHTNLTTLKNTAVTLDKQIDNFYKDLDYVLCGKNTSIELRPEISSTKASIDENKIRNILAILEAIHKHFDEKKQEVFKNSILLKEKKQDFKILCNSIITNESLLPLYAHHVSSPYLHEKAQKSGVTIFNKVKTSEYNKLLTELWELKPTSEELVKAINEYQLKHAINFSTTSIITTPNMTLTNNNDDL
jgi:hypothetical protein